MHPHSLAARQGRIGRSPGFTLVELIVAMALTAIIVLGATGLFANVHHQFFRLTVKQQAVFVLHGEMERLSALYMTATVAPVPVTATFAEAPTSRAVLPGVLPDAPAAMMVNNILGDFDETGEILYLDLGAGGASVEDRNVVWIDQSRRITGSLSFELLPLGGATGPCYFRYGDQPCQQLVVHLDYPFRFQTGSTDPLGAMENWDSTTRLSVMTIVGQRRTAP